jgi:long-chain fatty acid transport protein
MKTLSKSLFMVACLGGVAWGNAFNVNEHDAKVAGRGGASAASNTDPSSVSFNPGGIPIGEGTNIAINVTMYAAEGSYEDAMGKTTTDVAPQFAPAIFATSRLTDMVAVGVGLHFPFGLALSWPLGHRQADVAQDVTLKTYFITPSVGLNLNKVVPGLSIGGGVDIVPSTVELERAIFFGDVEGTARLAGDTVGFGGRVGVMYHPPMVKGLKLGVMWRSKVNLDFDGQGDFDVVQPFRSVLPPDGPIATSIDLPQQVWGGIAYDVNDQLELELDLQWTNWASTFTNDQLTIELPGTDPMTGAPNETVSDQRYSNETTIRLGAEYDINTQAAVRAGFIYDPTPISRETMTAFLPDIDRKDLTIGGTYAITPQYRAHLSFLWVIPGERETADTPNMPVFKGDYGATAWVTSLMVDGSFGK